MPIYSYECERCGTKAERIVRYRPSEDIDERDTQTCDAELPNEIPVGLDPAFHLDAEGKPVLDEVSIVPAGTQRDRHAVMQLPIKGGTCGGKLRRADIETFGFTKYGWKP